MPDPKKIAFLKAAIDRPVVLTGMMGTGKTTVGRILAADLGMPFFDTDRMIEDKAGMRITQIFETFGEERFRQSEASTVLELLQGGPCVIATGGGAPVNDVTRAALREKAWTVWLQAPAQTLLERIRRKQTRPLLQHEDPLSVLEDLIRRRRAFYEEADLTIDVRAGSLESVCEQITQALFERLKKDNV